MNFSLRNVACLTDFELLMVSRTTAHCVNPAEKAKCPLRKFKALKRGDLLHESTLEECPNILP